MGKGTIISGGTGGQYQVQINYNQDAYTARIAAFDATIAQYEAEISAWTGDAAGLASLQLSKSSADVSRAYLIANMPGDATVSAWCADFTEDLSGEVGTIEIPGESGTYNIQPGYEANAVYDTARDGQLVPTISQSPAAAFYNLAMLPGWQKWMPTYRYGTISNIDTEANTATVALSSAVSSQQGINVNQGTTLTGVDIEYMTCNAGAFEDGDSVLVKFEGQDVATPKIIGFKDNPKSCMIYIDFAECDLHVVWPACSGSAVYDPGTESISISAASIFLEPGVCYYQSSWVLAPNSYCSTDPQWGSISTGEPAVELEFYAFFDIEVSLTATNEGWDHDSVDFYIEFGWITTGGYRTSRLNGRADTSNNPDWSTTWSTVGRKKFYMQLDPAYFAGLSSLSLAGFGILSHNKAQGTATIYEMGASWSDMEDEGYTKLVDEGSGIYSIP